MNPAGNDKAIDYHHGKSDANKDHLPIIIRNKDINQRNKEDHLSRASSLKGQLGGILIIQINKDVLIQGEEVDISFNADKFTKRKTMNSSKTHSKQNVPTYILSKQTSNKDKMNYEL